MDRRGFLATLGVGTLAAAPRTPLKSGARRRFRPDDWASVREQFSLDPGLVHMATFLLASHPRPVAEAIEGHRRALDANPVDAVHRNLMSMEPEICRRIAEYTGGSGRDIALTDSTTMGLGLLYGTLDLAEGDEIVATTHCHYSTQMAVQHRAERTGASTRLAPLYRDPASASADEILTSVRRAITDRTRAFACTWVHSCDGLKLPIREISRVIGDVNQKRDPAEHVLLCVDGVHGFGNQAERVEDLGCDFFCAGTHKWIFGPRGTGLVWGRPEAWRRVHPVIPSFGVNYGVWLGLAPRAAVSHGSMMTPGGFHSFEHRWALPAAFDFHASIGPARIHERTAALNSQLKELIAGLRGFRLRTPRDPALSAGITCFDVEGHDPEAFAERLHERGVVASSSPYRNPCVRLAPSIVNTPAEVERCVESLAALR